MRCVREHARARACACTRVSACLPGPSSARRTCRQIETSAAAARAEDGPTDGTARLGPPRTGTTDRLRTRKAYSIAYSGMLCVLTRERHLQALYIAPQRIVPRSGGSCVRSPTMPSCRPTGVRRKRVAEVLPPLRHSVPRFALEDQRGLGAAEDRLRARKHLDSLVPETTHKTRQAIVSWL